MNSKYITIGKAAEIIGVSDKTLRRWDKTGKLPARRKKASDYRYYLKDDIDEYIKNNSKDLFRLAQLWVFDGSGAEPRADFYCQDSSIFQARLIRLERELDKVRKLKDIFPLIVAVVGEIGNNSFDHNLGNWPDIQGIFFAYDLRKKEIILADRGQGVLTTLKKIRPELTNDQDALRVAFTEIVSGRAPESRGNGLKFVREVVKTNEITLFFQSGSAELKIQKGDTNLNIKKSMSDIQGCLSLITF